VNAVKEIVLIQGQHLEDEGGKLSTEKQSFQVLKLLCRFARDFATIQQL
jgi:hypothetical protein